LASHTSKELIIWFHPITLHKYFNASSAFIVNFNNVYSGFILSKLVSMNDGTCN
jgi:hypothetical protein